MNRDESKNNEFNELPKPSDDQLPDDLPPETYLVAWVFVFGIVFILAIMLIAIF